MTRSEVTERLYGALQRAGIGFPYPIQSVRLEPSPTAVDSPMSPDAR